MVNKHNLKMTGLKKASGNTWNSDNFHTQISYNMETGEVLTSNHIGNNWTQYHDKNIIDICHTYTHLTMQEIADRIAFTVPYVKAWKRRAEELKKSEKTL